MAIFEAPIAHEAVHYSNPEGSHYNNPELEFEFEDEGSHYSNPEGSHYSNPEFEDEFLGNLIRGIGGLFGGEEGEFENEGSHYSNPEFEDESDRFLGNIVRSIGGLFGGEEGEFEDELSHYSNPEMEDEADHFLFGKLKGLFNRIKRRARGLAQRALRVAPLVTRALSTIASESNPMTDRMINQLAAEAEMEVAHMEQHFTNTFAQTGEMEHPEVHEALMSELLAANAAAAQTEAEAEAASAVTIPLTIRVMRAQRTLLPVTTPLVQANTQLVRTLRRQDPQLLLLLPRIHRLTVAILRCAAQMRRLTAPFAVRTLAVATNRVMSNPRKVERAVQRNMALRVRAVQTNRLRRRRTMRPLSLRRRRAGF